MSSLPVTGRRTRTTHGKCPRGKQPKKYTVWCNIKRRVTDPSHPAYKDYGGRGITMCEAWREDFAAFDADVPDPPDGKSTLDRTDNERGYEPGNVRWVLWVDQMNNTRRNVRLTYAGRTQTLAQWCQELGLNYGTVHHRLNLYGWSVEEALSGRRNCSSMY
jgi:hypothetical protein